MLSCADGGRGRDDSSPEEPAAPAIPALFTGAFRWLVLAHGVSSLAFFAYLGAAFAEATYRFGASSSQLAVLGAAIAWLVVRRHGVVSVLVLAGLLGVAAALMGLPPSR